MDKVQNADEYLKECIGSHWSLDRVIEKQKEFMLQIERKSCPPVRRREYGR